MSGVTYVLKSRLILILEASVDDANILVRYDIARNR